MGGPDAPAAQSAALADPAWWGGNHLTWSFRNTASLRSAASRVSRMSLHPKLTEGMTEVDCAREIARAAIWNSLYSEYGLRKAHREYALIKAVVQLGGFDVDGVKAEDETDDEPKEPMDIIRDLVAQMIGFN